MSRIQSLFRLSVGVVVLCLSNAEGADLYWGQYDDGADFVQRSNFDGTALESLPGFDVVAGIALDLPSGKMYVADLNGIKRANLDGTNIEPLVTHDHAQAIALDLQGGKMYWTSSEEALFAVYRSNLDGSNIQMVVPAQNDGFMLALALDLPHGYLYSSESNPGPGGRGVIYRSNLDGSNLVEVVDHPSFPGAYYYIETIALDLSGGKIYFDHGGAASKFFRANLDGSDLEAIYAAPLDSAIRGLVLDLCEGKMYWPESPLSSGSMLPSTIRRANLDGTNSETVFEIATKGSAVPLWGLTSSGYCHTWGDIYPYGVPEGDCVVALDDILCIVRGFTNPATCPSGDIFPCHPNGNGIINIDDMLGVLAAFSGNTGCGPTCP